MPDIVLTADRTLMADYPVLLDGVLGSVGTTFIPRFLYETFLSPRAPADAAGRPVAPPYGLRKLHAALRADGVPESAVAFAFPDELNRFGDARLIAVSSGDPLGHGMTSTVLSDLLGGDLYSRISFLEILERARRLRQRRPDLRICCGGPGMWQLVRDPRTARELGIDHIFLGYGEKTVPAAFRDLLAGRPLPPVIRCETPSADDIPAIRGPASLGAVEISRGCGRGCTFCTLRNTPMLHLPKSLILEEVRTTVAGGIRNISLLSEDFLRYGADGLSPRPDAVLDLFEAIAEIPGIRLIQLDHVNLSSVLAVDENRLRRLHDAIALGRDNEWIWMNAGIETASPRLLATLAPGKAAPFPLDTWPDMIRRSIDRLNRAGFMPFFSIILGSPGETEADLRQTLDLLESIRSERIALFPVFHVGVRPGEPSFGTADMTPLHWDLFSAAYEMNFRWVPPLFAANQKAGGVSPVKRLITQALGRMGIAVTRTHIRRKRRAPAPPSRQDG